MGEREAGVARVRRASGDLPEHLPRRGIDLEHDATGGVAHQHSVAGDGNTPGRAADTKGFGGELDGPCTWRCDRFRLLAAVRAASPGSDSHGKAKSGDRYRRPTGDSSNCDTVS